jgi:tetratricopeptide (TPR) repeat protein
MKSSLLKLFFLLIALSPLSALDLEFRVRPFFFIPLGESVGFFELGGGGDLLFDFDISSVLTNPLGIGYSLGLEGGILYEGVVEPSSGNIQPYFAGLGARVFYYPLSRLYLAAEGAVGLHQAVQHLINEGYDNGRWWRLGGEAGFRFNPALTLSLSGGWKDFSGSDGERLLTGIYAGLTAQFTFETRSSQSDVHSSISQDEPVYPLLLSLYRDNAAGTIKITNNETAEIRNVRVSFRAGTYTATEYPCGTIPLLPKKRSAEIPLYADFSPALLNFTEDGRIVGELVIRYTFLGRERTAVRNVAVQVYNRNRPIGDPAALAAFVSPTNPEVLEAAKFFAGFARSNRRTGLNQNMQFAVYLFEGMLAGDLWLRENSDTVAQNTVQFPAHTLAFRSGTAEDLGLLTACLLEGMGIRTAIIPLGNDFITAFSLGIGAAAADNFFNDMSKLLVINDEVWLPLSMAAFNRGFINSWEEAADRLGRVFEAGENVDFITLENAWGIYPPAPLPAQQLQFIQPREDTVKRGAALALDQYIINELDPKIAELGWQIRSSPSVLLYNRLGLLQMRSGRSAEAKAAFTRAADQGSLPALVNLGNLSFLDSDLTAAERYFNQVLSRDPENAAARRGLNSLAAERE